MRKRLIVVVAVVAVAVALVAGQLAMTRAKAPRPSSPQTSAASLELTSQTGVPGVVPPLPGGKPLAAIKAQGPAKDGVRLHPLSSSPSGLIAGLVNGRIPPGSAYTVRFRAWGYGPVGPTGQTVVLTASSLVASGSAPDISTMTKNPVLAVMDARKAGDVLVGGAHLGTLTFLSSEGQVVPVLSEVRGAE